jgi:tryptophan synthase alpha chain
MPLWHVLPRFLLPSTLGNAGAGGVLILDLPPDEAARNAELMKSHSLLAIRLIAPTKPPERMELIAKSAEGFIYYVSREGVTGEQTSLSASIGSQVLEIKSHSSPPIARAIKQRS